MADDPPIVPRSDFERALVAGAYYFQIIFALGFILGTFRTLVLAPVGGETAAVLVELPIILGTAWLVARRLILRFKVTPEHRLAMGAFALLLLLICEAVLSLYLFERTFSQHLAHYRTLPGALGLSGQCLFAVLPALLPREPRG